jgi:hypothetical protein
MEAENGKLPDKVKPVLLLVYRGNKIEMNLTYESYEIGRLSRCSSPQWV